eukprot:gene22967-30156_t
MGIRLAQAGLIVAIPSYTLYPEAKGPQMVKEMSDALGWLFDNVAELGGDVDNLTLTGHSAALATSIKAGEVPATLPPSPPNDSSSTSHANLDDPATAAAELAATGSAHEGSLKEEAGYLHGAENRSKGQDSNEKLYSQDCALLGNGAVHVTTMSAKKTDKARQDETLASLLASWEYGGVYDTAGGPSSYEFERSRNVLRMSMMKRASVGDAWTLPSMSPSRDFWRHGCCGRLRRTGGAADEG